MTEIDLKELASEINEEFQKQLEQMLWSELSIASVVKELEFKPIKIDMEYKQDYVFYAGRYWFSMPYRKEWGLLGLMNVCS